MRRLAGVVDPANGPMFPAEPVLVQPERNHQLPAGDGQVGKAGKPRVARPCRLGSSPREGVQSPPHCCNFSGQPGSNSCGEIPTTCSPASPPGTLTRSAISLSVMAARGLLDYFRADKQVIVQLTSPPSQNPRLIGSTA